MESDPAAFRVQLQQFLTFLDENNENIFLQYFRNNYCNRVEQWATCYRLGTHANTNMFAEAFHRLLKMVYLHQKQNRRIDYLLHILLRISKDKVYKRLQKTHKGKYSHRRSEIIKRHKSAQRMVAAGSVPVPKGEHWQISSEVDASQIYTISKVTANCSCELACSSCHVCVHMYSCTCLDFALHTTVCKHIHTLGIETNILKCDKQEKPFSDLDYFGEVLQTDGCTVNDELIILRKKIATLLDHLYTVVNACGDHNALLASTQHIKAAVMVITAISSNPNQQVLPKKRMIAPNTNINKQPRFFKTKQTKLSKILQLPKPSNYEQRVSKQTLSEINTKFCAICFCEDDTNISSDNVEWVYCVRCSMWIQFVRAYRCKKGRPLYL